VYLDASGSAPLTDRTREALVSAIDEGWADPERLHAESRRARALLDGARESIASVLGSPVEHIFFVPTYGLGCDRVVRGVVGARRDRNTIVASEIERRPLLRIAQRVSSETAIVLVDAAGIIDLDQLRAVLDPESVSVALVQHANQEIGSVQPLAEAYEFTTAARVPLIVDATASIGHIDPPQYWDALVADPADWGAPQGVSVMAFRTQTRYIPVPPTVDNKVNVPVCLAAAVALEEREENRQAVTRRLDALTKRIRGAAEAVGETMVFWPVGSSLPHIASFACARLDGETLASELDRRGFAVGSGSACTTEPSPQSHVWDALGVNGRGIIRVGLHPGVTAPDVEAFIVALGQAVESARAFLPPR
jgi:cysteine desulfurase